ncbi:PTS sorbitol transporter subunit IIA [Aerococcus agrisoli]|uniref:PTS sorbitol transporter subunit IIA n=1 Tax=Aerococcus agrisoli TaxID=2487350 RepID=A0A3N4GNQ3_9LACT|nr:PTS glucitol/sorbitol transporter subunit IIA [Aerococcus agrisoli]RPA60761.1 PTS sorbitol transporter subunit IIA [Aerococcus agrisoli]
MTVYQTEVFDIGAQAELFQAENMILLFGKDASQDLAEYCFNIYVNQLEDHIEPGMTVKFDDNSYEITAVGNVVEKNLVDLGHITINFNGATTADLAGTLYVEAKPLPNIEVGTAISIHA